MSTMRDRLEAQRAGFVAGIRATSSGRWTPTKQAAAESMAANAYPAPTYERPRVVTVPSPHGSRWNLDFKVENGVLWSRTPAAPHHSAMTWRKSAQTPESLHALLGLFAHPTETVEVP